VSRALRAFECTSERSADASAGGRLYGVRNSRGEETDLLEEALLQSRGLGPDSEEGLKRLTNGGYVEGSRGTN